MHLGLFLHRCNADLFFAYRCNSDLTLLKAEQHQVDMNELEECRFPQAILCFAKFKPYVEAFYTDPLELFYRSTFDMEQARMKVESILTEVDVS
jgi:hypothetical protein